MESVQERETPSPQHAPAFPPSVQLLQLTTGTMVSQAVGVTARLGVADVLSGGPKSADDIAAAVHADRDALYRLLRAVADRGVVEHRADDTFALTPIGELLRSDIPGSLRDWATMCALPFHRDAWTDLFASIKTGEPAFPRVNAGDRLFDYLADHPEDAAVFDGAMTALSVSMQGAIVGAFDFSRCSTIVDVGGGRGALLATILRANPSVRGVLFDVPSLAADARATFEQAGVSSRAAVVEGDFFERVPEGGDLYLLSNILHDWDDATAARILRSCRSAMAPGAKLLIVEQVLPEGAIPSTAKLVDLEMLALTGGRQRDAAAFTRLLAETGFELIRAEPSRMDRPASYVEGKAV